MQKRVVIVGGGFGGIRTALDLSKKNIKDLKITLISDKNHFEYYPTLYKVVTGNSPLEVCIPLNEVFHGRNIEIIKDKIVAVDPTQKNLKGESGSVYEFDYLVLALGSETAYFNVPGLEELAFSFKSINEALKLKSHLHKLFENILTSPKEELVSNLHILIVGGGPTGVELAGELVSYMRGLAIKHNIDPSLVAVDLIEASPRPLPSMPESVSEKVLGQLRKCGVNVYLNRAVMKEDVEQVFLKDMTMKSKTVIWTAGTKTNSFYSKIEGFQFQKNGRVIVDDFFRPQGFENVFVIGDAAAMLYSGLAQTALNNGAYLAKYLKDEILKKPHQKYKPKSISYAIPVGPGWAAVMIGKIKFYGPPAWWLRRIIDLMFFSSIVPLSKALKMFIGGKMICESCKSCLPENK